MIDFLTIFLSAIFAAIFAFPVWKWCVNKKMMNEVTSRSSHKTPTPRGGGLTFMIPTTLFGFAWYAYTGHTLEHAPFILSILIGAPLLAVLGWLEDKIELSSKVRFGAQLAIVGAMVYFMPPVFEVFVGFTADKIILTLAWVWFINLFNFMDGLNTFATAQAIFMAIALVLLGSIFKPVLLVLAGTCIGFLRVNITPAKIFMGDVGSLYLGGLLGGVMFYQLSLDPSTWMLPMFTLSLLFTFDATFTLFKRMLNGKKPWEAHKEHFYQRANQLGWSHEQVTLKAVFLNVFLLFITIAQLITTWDIPLFCMALGLMMVSAKYIKIMENKK